MYPNIIKSNKKTFGAFVYVIYLQLFTYAKLRCFWSAVKTFGFRVFKGPTSEMESSHARFANHSFSSEQ